MVEIIQDTVIRILDNRIKVIESYKITDRKVMKEILYAFQYKHPELKFNRGLNDLIREWVAHNRLYKWGIQPEKTKHVDLEFEETKKNLWIYRILGI